MEDDPVVLDEHRGMSAQQATEIRRRLAEVEADQAALRGRRTELETFLLAAPASLARGRRKGGLPDRAVRNDVAGAGPAPSEAHRRGSGRLSQTLGQAGSGRARGQRRRGRGLLFEASMVTGGTSARDSRPPA